MNTDVCRLANYKFTDINVQLTLGLTNSARMGINTVAVAVLLVHCVSAHITKQHMRLAANGDRAFSGVSCKPIHRDSPDSYKQQQSINYCLKLYI